MKVVLDTNFLLVPFAFKVDVFSQISSLVDAKAEYVVMYSCLGEINSLGLKDKIAAKAGLELAKKAGAAIVRGAGGKPDDDILDFALKNRENCVVCTTDVELRRRLRDAGVRSICLRQRKVLKIC